MASTLLLLFNGFSCLLSCNPLLVFDDFKPAQAEMAKAVGNDHHVNSEPEPGDSHVDEEEEHITSAEHGASEGEVSSPLGTRIKSYSSEVSL